jgi:hypothetical protein
MNKVFAMRPGLAKIFEKVYTSKILNFLKLTIMQYGMLTV